MARRRKKRSTSLPTGAGASSQKVTPQSAPSGFGKSNIAPRGATKLATRYRGVKPIQRKASGP